MKKLKKHVDKLFSDVPDSDEKEVLKQEIYENLQEKVQDLIEQGKDEEDAINKAIVEFGDIDEIKMELVVTKNPLRKNNTKYNLGFSIWGSLLIISLFVFANFYYTPDNIWFVYPTFVVLWWPSVMFYYWRKTR
ncbi:hypothetical protein SAMN05444392_10878 [Seinonella peptonophila]|uniref:2TM domain-containing protein n=1 Tax=Seinonella peptonophila TaxID=112248 RepID=A0A1M4Z759_9BACL|nr:permease prefix domain 1-containing protein [Seinonella peptonophila]SHF13850.1 hypothetical protein SAMN05444392_10878 [Seinonella peptonophila]